MEATEEPISLATKEAEEAIAQVIEGQKTVELSPQNSYLRMLQHQLAERYKLSSKSTGREPRRRVRIFHTGELNERPEVTFVTIHHI
jgi:predicted RNA-binding protein Jag